MKRKRIGLVQACDSPQLFNFKLYPKQREILAAIERGTRLHILCAGRRSGKTSMAALVLLWNLLLQPQLDGYVRPGERRYGLGVATNLAQARLLVDAARSIVERSPLLAELIEATTEDSLTFSNGTELRAMPCSSRGGRGFPVSCLVLDELAHFLDSDGSSAAPRVWAALLPSVAQFHDDARVIASSTPYGSSGLFYELFTKASDGELDAVVQHGSTAEINPAISQDLLDQERARDPEAFESEYLAQFLTGGSAYLDPQRIAAAVDQERGELSPDEHIVNPVAALDVGFKRDQTALVIVGRDPLHFDHLRVACVRSWKPQQGGELGFEPLLDEVVEVCRDYGATSAVVDQFASVPVRQYLSKKGLHARELTLSANTQNQIFSTMKSKLYAGELELFPHPELLAELGRLEVHYTPGAASIRSPRVGPSHGDLAISLAMAAHAQRDGGAARGAPVLVGRQPRFGTTRVGDQLPRRSMRDR